jgi:hypothetical protein
MRFITPTAKSEYGKVNNALYTRVVETCFEAGVMESLAYIYSR